MRALLNKTASAAIVGSRVDIVTARPEGGTSGSRALGKTMAKSKFRYALHLLSPLKRPLFYKMLKTARAYPMTKGIHLALAAAAPEYERRTIRGLAVLTGTRRYQRALLEENAVRYDAEGLPAEAVTDADREHAKLRLKNLNRKAGAGNELPTLRREN